jgi:hypothetical protein
MVIGFITPGRLFHGSYISDPNCSVMAGLGLKKEKKIGSRKTSHLLTSSHKLPSKQESSMDISFFSRAWQQIIRTGISYLLSLLKTGT